MDCVPGVVAASRTSTVQDGCVRLLDALYRAHTDSGETGHIRKNLSSLYETQDPYTWNYSEFPDFYSAYKRPYLRYWRGLMSHFHILCSPIPDLQNGIGFLPLSSRAGPGPVNITCVQYLLIQQFYAIHFAIHLVLPVFCDREGFLVVFECRDSDQS